ncbi:MAG: chemotaxis protein CheW [Gammaproteobacteria bacterium]|nr:chemotaxis protein CheW [Gammaproteobacteria bacterium]
MNQVIQEVYSLLIPIADGRIILPRTAVAEVMGYTAPKDRPDDAPDWLLGTVNWQGQPIPLISFEAACGRAVPERGRRTRIAVLFAIGGKLEPSAFALMTQGYPYLVRVNSGVLQVDDQETGEVTGPVLSRTRMANERPLIPDLESLEYMIAGAMGLMPDEAAMEEDEIDQMVETSDPESDEATEVDDVEADADNTFDDLEIDLGDEST